MSQEILEHREGGVCTLTINRPAKKNAFTIAMYTALADAVEAAAADTTVRVLLIQGNETVFSAGNDLPDFLENPPVSPDAPVFRMLGLMANFPKPFMAAVAGPAVGIGSTMLLHCDLIYAADNAAFSMPFVNLGLCPEGASSLLLPRLMGHQRASEVLLLGEPFYAEAALEVGLVSRVLPPTELLAHAQAVAAKLAAKPLAALLETKRLMKLGVQADVNARIGVEQEAVARLVTAPAAKEAFTAFTEKRKPDFSKLNQGAAR